ncbi:type VI secretion system membrane subunit TssM [Endozoicomonas sp. GU-1]|uniref:type VI secretion system membrane subunit TssM n=1 Tax=Endozoicomonas sp. GU-1 TaxID=3009078 RepID=UPI0022B34CDC|nr:type VI secretion system membrane subunit TssM [Endozoicomonas sp. GU-1]WBA83898.1 type VI secretion system membrane subunit TssM [Endozoicomonas sp. GU-1]WBA86879.1 type VI secretion system membrane subunit TssM [Endozoicomonas sp. GU-1]
MTNPIIIVASLSVLLLSMVWFAPLVSGEWLSWLTAVWQWVLSLIIVLACCLILWLVLRRQKARGTTGHVFETTSDDSSASGVSEQKAQYKQQLMYDWNQLWKILNSRHGKKPYTLAWLVMIGTEGSGKSSWLISAGFEKVTTASPNRVSSIVFWLSEHAVIVELVGQYYTRDKEQLDEFLLDHLLVLVRKKRPRRPLNGILAALSTEQLLLRDPNGLLEQARQLRWRLLYINQRFANTLPVWILLTQADRLNGFMELIRRMSSQRQMFPFGFYLKEGYHPEQFREAFDLCHTELSDKLFDCLHPEKDSNARQAQVRYVLQFSLLGERLHFFCDEIFLPRYGVSTLQLKGVWFSSCGQHGSTINLLATEIARLHGFRAQPVQPQIPGNQSYFSQQFFNRILFNDMGNVREDPMARKFWLARIYLMSGALVAILAAGLSFCWSQIEYNEQLLAQQKMIIRDYRYSMEQLMVPLNQPKAPEDTIPVSDVLQLLDGLQLLHRMYRQSSRWMYYGGLMDWETANDIQLFYQQQLRHYLLSPLARHLHDRLHKALSRHSKGLFDDLQYYLMLLDPKVRNTELLHRHIRKLLLHDPEGEAGRQLDSLLTDIWHLEGDRITASIPPDQALIERAREALSTKPPERLVYDHLRRLPQFSGTLDTRDLFGNEFGTLFTAEDDSGNTRIPRFYTRNLYSRLDLSASSPMLKREIISLNRIQKGESEISAIELSRISRRVREFYFQDYIRTWDNLIHRIRLQPAISLDQIEQQTNLLTRGGAALQALVNMITSETSLAEESPAASAKVPGLQPGAVPPAAIKANRILNQAARLLPAGQVGKVSPDNPAIVNQAFAEYTGYAADLQSRLTPVLDQLLQELQDINGHFDPDFALYQLAATVMGNKQNILQSLWHQADSDDTRAGQWLNQLAGEVWSRAIAGAARYCQRRWQQEIYPFWSQHLYARFPLVTDAGNDIQLTDFTVFFKPGGLLDDFAAILKPFLQTQPARQPGVWHLKTVKGQQLPVKGMLLQQMNHAQRLQQQLFNPDGTLQVNYRLRMLALSNHASEFSLRDSNGRFVYRHGPMIWQKRQWPGPEEEQINVTLSNDSVVLAQQQYSGPWAWLRFVFDGQQWQKNYHVDLLFGSKEYQTRLELELERGGNPFGPSLYDRIKLPGGIIRADI